MGRAGRVAGTRELVVTGTPYIAPYRVRTEVAEEDLGSRGEMAERTRRPRYTLRDERVPIA